MISNSIIPLPAMLPYKVNLTKEQMLTTKGSRVDVSKWIFPIKENWNWLPYPLTVNKVTNEALAYFDAKGGDVIKDLTYNDNQFLVQKTFKRHRFATRYGA